VRTGRKVVFDQLVQPAQFLAGDRGGFSSSQYFVTVFKRYTLVNPPQFHLPKTR
jgi:hypothetical protein